MLKEQSNFTKVAQLDELSKKNRKPSKLEDIVLPCFHTWVTCMRLTTNAHIWAIR